MPMTYNFFIQPSRAGGSPKAGMAGKQPAALAPHHIQEDAYEE